MKLKKIIFIMARGSQKVRIIDYSKQQTIFGGIANEIPQELKDMDVVFIDAPSNNEIIIDVKKGY